MSLTAGDIQDAILKILWQNEQQPGQSHLSKLISFSTFWGAVETALPEEGRPKGTRLRPLIVEGVWSLFRQGLAYLDFGVGEGDKVGNWCITLTEAGRLVAAEELALTPDAPSAYLAWLWGEVPEASPTVRQYVGESVAAYTACCYLASAVMTGVASEAAFFEMALAFADAMGGKAGKDFRDYLEKKDRPGVHEKFEEFRKRLDPHLEELRRAGIDGLPLDLDSVFHLIKQYRNDSGHPTGKVIKRDQMRRHHFLLAGLLRAMYDVKAHFDHAAAAAAAASSDSST